MSYREVKTMWSQLWFIPLWCNSSKKTKTKKTHDNYLPLCSPEISSSSHPSVHPSLTVLPLASFSPQGLTICECWLRQPCEGQPWWDMWAPDCHPWGWAARLIDFKPGCVAHIRTQWLDSWGTKDKFTEGCFHLVGLCQDETINKQTGFQRN